MLDLVFLYVYDENEWIQFKTKNAESSILFITSLCIGYGRLFHPLSLRHTVITVNVQKAGTVTEVYIAVIIVCINS